MMDAARTVPCHRLESHRAVQGAKDEERGWSVFEDGLVGAGPGEPDGGSQFDQAFANSQGVVEPSDEAGGRSQQQRGDGALFPVRILRQAEVQGPNPARERGGIDEPVVREESKNGQSGPETPQLGTMYTQQRENVAQGERHSQQQRGKGDRAGVPTGEIQPQQGEQWQGKDVVVCQEEYADHGRQSYIAGRMPHTAPSSVATPANPGRWTAAKIPALAGNRAVVTGANSGIGWCTALELARAGAQVVLACRDLERGSQAVREMSPLVPDGRFEFRSLDLADLESVRAFAARWVRECSTLDLLVNNAGVMLPPNGLRSAQGLELQMATNYLGHFALLRGLLPSLQRSTNPRVVWVSSIAARYGRIDALCLDRSAEYFRAASYADSKLAMVSHARETAIRHPWLTCVVAHPGVAATSLGRWFSPRSTRLFGQSAAKGALPSLRACVEVPPPDSWFGPSGLGQLRGYPVSARLPERSMDRTKGSMLWELSERKITQEVDF